MKKYFLYGLTIIPLFYWGCDKPASTELVDDNSSSDAYEVEILAKEVDNEYYSNGYDTLGVTEDVRNFSSIISVSGIKFTKNGKTETISVAQTILSDLSKPVYSPGGTLIGYNTITPGVIKFNSETAHFINYRVKYRENGTLIDTVLGRKYELYNRSGRLLSDDFNFTYDSYIYFSFVPLIGQETNFNITTPKEITGQVKLNEIPDQNSFNAELSWDAEYGDNFYVIVGGVFTNTESTLPFYKLKTADDGNLIVPASLLKNIPRDRFNKISISFVRKNIYQKEAQSNELYVSSQSIHTIILDLP